MENNLFALCIHSLGHFHRICSFFLPVGYTHMVRDSCEVSDSFLLTSFCISRMVELRVDMLIGIGASLECY